VPLRRICVKPPSLRFLRVSPGRFHAWRRREGACALNDQSSCPRTSPSRLTPLEVRSIEKMVASPDYRHVPTGTLAVLAQRLGKVWASPSTWYRAARPDIPRFGARVVVTGTWTVALRRRVEPAPCQTWTGTTGAGTLWCTTFACSGRSESAEPSPAPASTDKYRTISAISPGDEILLPDDAISDLNWSDTHPVSVGPGSTAFTVMPCPASSTLKVMVNASNAALVTTYAIWPGIGLWPCPEVMLMMRLGLFDSGCRANSAHKRTDARTFTA
jgi:hypothetical protein